MAKSEVKIIGMNEHNARIQCRMMLQELNSMFEQIVRKLVEISIAEEVLDFEIPPVKLANQWTYDDALSEASTCDSESRSEDDYLSDF
jgi:hypothetical protein